VVTLPTALLATGAAAPDEYARVEVIDQGAGDSDLPALPRRVRRAAGSFTVESLTAESRAAESFTMESFTESRTPESRTDDGEHDASPVEIRE
jgi:hypothetical protein